MNSNRKLLIFIAINLFFSVFLTGCFGKASEDSSNNASEQSILSSSATEGTDSSVVPVSVKYDPEDYSFDWESQPHKTIDMSQGSQAITSSGIYEITGSATDASLNVNVNKDEDKNTVFLVLNGVNINSSSTSPIYIAQAKKVVIILNDQTNNTVTQGTSVVVNENSEPSAAIFSKEDLTLAGNGCLEVKSDYNDGITSKDKLKITGGTINIIAKNDGIVGKDLVAVENASITVNAGKDGIRSTNSVDSDKGNVVINGGTFVINSSSDAIQAEKALEINGGTFTVNGGGGFCGVIKSNDMGGGRRPWNNNNNTSSSTDETSKKGLKGTQSILITGGSFTLNAYDDTIHTNGSLVITGGSFCIQAGAKGIHADKNATISNADIKIINCFEGVEAVNITVNSGKLNITATDDTFNVNNAQGVLTISGGEIYLNCGGDGIDSNGSVVMNGGTVYVDGPTENNNGAIDYDSSFTVNGGTLIASGSSGMAQAPQAGSQPSIMMYFSTTQSSGSTIELKDENSNVIASFTPSKQYSSVAITAPGIKNGSKYSLFAGGTQIVSFTVSQTITYLDENGVTTNKGGNPGGRPNGNPGNFPGPRG